MLPKHAYWCNNCSEDVLLAEQNANAKHNVCGQFMAFKEWYHQTCNDRSGGSACTFECPPPAPKGFLANLFFDYPEPEHLGHKPKDH